MSWPVEWKELDLHLKLPSSSSSDSTPEAEEVEDIRETTETPVPQFRHTIREPLELLPDRSHMTLKMGSMSHVRTPPLNFESVLLPFYFRAFMQSIVHDYAEPIYRNMSYWNHLAGTSPALKHAISACAAAALGFQFNSRFAISEAEKHYVKALQMTRETLQNSSCDGSEDWLLATSTALCLVEYRRADVMPHLPAAHLAAQKHLLRQRIMKRRYERLKPSSPESPPSSPEGEFPDKLLPLAFERAIFESCYYHGINLILTGVSLDNADHIEYCSLLDLYFSTSYLPVDNRQSSWPILGMPYALYSIAGTVIKLASEAPWEDEEVIEKAARLMEQLQSWERQFEFQDEFNLPWEVLKAYPPMYIGHTEAQAQAKCLPLLVIYATKLLITRCHPGNEEIQDEAAARILRKAVNVVRLLDLTGVTLKIFYLWPLIVLRQGSVSENDKTIFQRKIDSICASNQTAMGFSVPISRTVEWIWTKTEPSSAFSSPT